jgi:hypothetical protein
MCKVLHTVENSQKELDSLTVGYDLHLVGIALIKEKRENSHLCFIGVANFAVCGDL